MTDLRQEGKREEMLYEEVGEEVLRKIADGHMRDIPLQVEVHPYHRLQGDELGHPGAGCSNECDHCTRGNDRFDLEKLQIPGIDPSKLVELVNDLGQHKVNRVIFSGNSTEPLLYPHIAEVIQAVKDSGMLLRLYSNFHFGEKIDRETIRHLGTGDLIRVSIDAGSAEAYDRSHHPRIKSAFEKIQANLEGLLEERKQASEGGKSFEVHLTFLLTSANSNPRDIQSLVTWANEHRVDAIRFTLPLMPKGGADHFSHTPLLSAEEEKVTRELLEALSLEKGATKIITALEDPSQPEKNFLRCHHWKLIAVLGACGMFFPCTSVSLVALKNSLGRSLDDYPNFWDFWHDEKKWEGICPQTCADGSAVECTRFEYAVNEVIDRLKGTRGGSR